MGANDDIDQRVLVLAPSGRDGALTARLLEQHGMASHVCADLDELLAQLVHGAGAAVVVQEALTPAALTRAAAVLEQQPPWSDLPMIVFTAREASARQNVKVLEALAGLGNVTAVERPVHPATLVSATRAALRARQRQYQTRRVLDQRESEVRHRDRFLAMLGHELRNPLSAIQHASDSLGLAHSDLARDRKALSVIDRQVRHLTRLVDDLLDVARVTSGKIALQTQAFDLGPLVRTAAEEVAQRYPGRQADLVVDLPEGELTVSGDPVRMHQVFANLVTNAFKYTPPGGRIALTVVRDGDWVVARLQDSGVGISAEVLPTIFEPFAQADRTLDRAQGGMGLGLTVVRSLVELHGGEVQVASAGPGQGSAFTIRLALSRSSLPPERAGAPQPAGPGPRRGHHVLVIEDADDIRESLHELLTDLGHRVDVAADGKQGVEQALVLRPDVALVDIGLPLLDGYEVARRVRAALGSSVLLVALTGYGQPEDAARAHAAGFDVHLRKPMSIAQIDRVLSEHQPVPGKSGTGDQAGQDQGVQRDHQTH